MKKVFIGLTILTLVAVGAIAYAQGPGWHGGNQGGLCCGYGYHMKGAAYGGPMMGWRGAGHDQKFLDETVGLRKELHEKRFDYFEATRNPKTDTETITKLKKRSVNFKINSMRRLPVEKIEDTELLAGSSQERFNNPSGQPVTSMVALHRVFIIPS